MQIAVLVVFVDEEYLHVGEVVVAKMSFEIAIERRSERSGEQMQRRGGEVVWPSSVGLAKFGLHLLHDVEEE